MKLDLGQFRADFRSIAEEAIDRLFAKRVEPTPVFMDFVGAFLPERFSEARGKQRLPIPVAIIEANLLLWTDFVRAPFVIGAEMMRVASDRAKRKSL